MSDSDMSDTEMNAPAASASTGANVMIKLPKIHRITSLTKKSLPNIPILRIKAENFFCGLAVESKLETDTIIKNNKYPFERYEIKTPDNYILNVFRIPCGIKKRNKHKYKRLPVLVVNGLLSSSDDWVNSGTRKSLGYVLAEEGYDVWLANCRGTRYATHTKHDVESTEFLDFTLHEIALNDLSTIIDKILEVTKTVKLCYIGYCQSTTLSYILCSEKPEYNEKIAINISLAPIAYASDMQCPVIKIINYLQDKGSVKAYFTKDNFELKDKIRSKCIKYIDCPGYSLDILCLTNMFVTLGYNPSNTSESLLPFLYDDNSTSTASMKQFLHYSQICKSGRFCPWNYGEEFNKTKYDGAELPPEYNVKNITTPIAIFVGTDDWVSRLKDAEEIKSKFTEASVTITVCDSYTHLDFLHGFDVLQKVYLPVIEEMSKAD